MNIALAIQNADPSRGGAEAYTHDLAQALAHRGHAVTLVAERGKSAAGDGQTALAYHTLLLGAKGATRWGRLQNFLRRLRTFDEAGPHDILHAMLPVWRCDVYQPHSGFAAEMLSAGHLKYAKTWRRSASWMGNRLHAKRRGLAKIEMAMMQPQPRVLCFSTAMRDFAQQAFAIDPERLVPLMNGINLAKFTPAAENDPQRTALRAQWKISGDQIAGLFLSNNWKLKGLAEAIDALAHCGEKKMVLLVAGRDDPAKFRELARRAGVADRVMFVAAGRGVGDPVPLYRAADFFLLPTRRDTCSLVVLEALAMGLPVITTLQNGASEALEDGRHGLILDRGDAPGLIRALGQLSDPARRGEMAKAALRLRESLSFDHHVDRLEAMYATIHADRSGQKLPALR